MDQLGIVNLNLFMLAVLLLNITPGPDTAYIVGRSVTQGRAAGLVSALGISFGCCLHSLACTLGLTALLVASATTFALVKVIGGIYLVYLGVRLVFAPSTSTSTTLTSTAKSLTTIFGQATMTNLLNPKVVLFFLSFFPQFVRSNATHKTAAFLLLGVIFVVITTIWNSSTALLAGTLARRAQRNAQIRQWVQRTVGSVFVLFGVKLVGSKI